MNNSNENNNNEGLNAVSLGSVENNAQNLNIPINDIPPVEPLPETLDTNVEQLDTPTNSTIEESSTGDGSGMENTTLQDSSQPDINQIPTDIPPLEPVDPTNYDIPEIIDNAPVFNDIGTVPPISGTPIINAVAEPAIPEAPKKKGFNKILFVIIILIALGAVGGGVYILLNKTNQPVVQTKRVKIEAGSSISTNINDYATFKNIDSSTCNFDTTEITDTKAIGTEYDFKVNCGNRSYVGKAVIVDTVAPEVDMKDDNVKVKVGEEVLPEEFITNCTDISKCNYSFKDQSKVKGFLAKEGTYKVEIVIQDDSGNKIEKEGRLEVVNEDEEVESTVSLVCTKTNSDYLETNKLGIFESEFNKSTVRTYTFSFDSKSDYEKAKGSNKENSSMTYSGITGTASFDDKDLTISLTKKIPYNDLVSEFGDNIPTQFAQLQTFFKGKGYACKIGF